MATSHAAGPDTLSGDLLSNHTIIHQIIPAIIPAIGSAPLATAIPRQSGTATRNTAIHAGRSYFSVEIFIVCVIK